MVSQTKWPITRGFAKQAVNTIACGTPVDSGDSVELGRTSLAEDGIGVRVMGASGTRRSARPLNLEGVDVNENSGALRRENAKPYLNDMGDEQGLAPGCLTFQAVEEPSP